MKKPPPESPALHLIRHMWENVCDTLPHSWRIVNGSMHQVVKLAIDGGLRWGLGDFATVAKDFRIGYWGGNNGDSEGLYSCAVESGNLSACLSFEAWKGRKPFIFHGKRISVGYDFRWAGERVTCTSFADDGASLIATSYKPRETDGDGYERGRRTPLHVHRISHADIKAAQKKAKAVTA